MAYRDIIGGVSTDRLRSQEWRRYLAGAALREVWRPPDGSPYSRSFKTGTLDSVATMAPHEVSPRHSDDEISSEAGLNNLINNGQLDDHTAIILDSGGAHSIAMAAVMA